MAVTITPTTAAEIRSFYSRDPPGRIRALTVRVDGEVKGIGGYKYHTDGSRVAFLDASEADCSRYRITLAKAVRAFFAMARADGVHRLAAECDDERAAAARFLARHGFTQAGTHPRSGPGAGNNKTRWLWQA